jgi:hypothetical protein
LSGDISVVDHLAGAVVAHRRSEVKRGNAERHVEFDDRRRLDRANQLVEQDAARPRNRQVDVGRSVGPFAWSHHRDALAGGRKVDVVALRCPEQSVEGRFDAGISQSAGRFPARLAILEAADDLLVERGWKLTMAMSSGTCERTCVCSRHFWANPTRAHRFAR